MFTILSLSIYVHCWKHSEIYPTKITENSFAQLCHCSYLARQHLAFGAPMEPPKSPLLNTPKKQIAGHVSCSPQLLLLVSAVRMCSTYYVLHFCSVDTRTRSSLHKTSSPRSIPKKNQALRRSLVDGLLVDMLKLAEPLRRRRGLGTWMNHLCGTYGGFLSHRGTPSDHPF